MLNKADYLSALEDAFWAGYNARQKQLDIVLGNTFGDVQGYQRAQISAQDILDKVLDGKKSDSR